MILEMCQIARMIYAMHEFKNEKYSNKNMLARLKVVMHPCNTSALRWMHEDHKFKATVGYLQEPGPTKQNKQIAKKQELLKKQNKIPNKPNNNNNKKKKHVGKNRF
jgi:hypothetical protein